MAFDKPDGTEIGVKCEIYHSPHVHVANQTDGRTVAQLGWLRDVPWGFRRLLNYLYQRYKKPIYMTENVSHFALKCQWMTKVLPCSVK